MGATLRQYFMDCLTVRTLIMLLKWWYNDKSNEKLFADVAALLILERRFAELLSAISDAPESLQKQYVFTSIDAHLALKQCNDARNVVSQFLEDSPLKAYYLAKVEYIAGNLDEAISVLDAAESALKIDSNGYLLKARLHFLLSEYESAQRCLDEVSEITRGAEFFGLSALIALDCGDFASAKHYSDAALKHDNSQTDALLSRASLLISALDFISAENIIEQSLIHLPNSGRIWSLRGQVSLLKGLYEQSSNEFAVAAKLMPEHVGTLHLLAWSHYLLGDFQEAENVFNQALKVNDAFSDSYGGLAISSIALGKSEVAERYIKIAKRLDKFSFTAQYASILLDEFHGYAKDTNKRIEEILENNSHIEGKRYIDLIPSVIHRRTLLG